MDLVIKKGENTNLTAQPPTLAVFPPWGDSEGAGRPALTGGKSKNYSYEKQVSIE